jgi:uncharacterized LabA/DUF88 family protein
VGKNVAVFVDVANIFYAAKAAGVDIDYVTLLKAASAGRDLVRAYAYTGLDPDNENQRNFHDFLRRSNYKVVSKDIRKYGDGKVKANLDIELVVDMMKTARNLDIAIVVSGDGDFAPAIRAVQEQGVRVEVISFRGNTSSDLMEVADQFTDITQLARVEKGSRSGRRVATEDDLSMTEVPDKQTEGTGAGRGRGGRGRGRGRAGEAEPVAASSRGRGRGRPAPVASESSENGAEGGLRALPGERLSKGVGSLTEADLAAAEVFTLDDADGEVTTAASAPDHDAGEVHEDDGADAQRRRRRRGGRGRGRGRGRDEAAPAGVSDAPEATFDVEEPEEDDEPAAAPRGPRTTPFGSVWDSQLGTPTAPVAANLTPLADDEDFDEPEIPEYLIAEQRRGSRPGRGGQGAPSGRGPRGGRSAYQSAMDRERYGRGGGGGINRYPDVSGGRGPGSLGSPGWPGAPAGRGAPPRDDRSYSRGRDERPRDRDAAPRSSSEPWSEVPPELEAMLRSQVAQKPSSGPAPVAPADVTPTPADAPAIDGAPAPKRRTTRKAASTADSPGDASAADAASPAPKRRTTRKAAPATESGGTPDVAASAEAAEAPPKRRSTRKPAAATADAGADAGSDATATTAPKRRSTRKPAATPADAGSETA